MKFVILSIEHSRWKDMPKMCGPGVRTYSTNSSTTCLDSPKVEVGGASEHYNDEAASFMDQVGGPIPPELSGSGV